MATRVIACLMLLLPVVVLLNGMAAAASFIVLGLILYACFGGSKKSAAFYKSAFISALVVCAWPLLTAGWSIDMVVSLSSGLRTFGMLFACFVMVGLVAQQPVPVRWLQYYVAGVAAASILLVSELLPGGGVLTHAIDMLQLDPIRFFNKNINRGLCAIAVLLWPALLLCRHKQVQHIKWLLLLPLVLLAGIFSQHSLSAKMGIAVGGMVFYLSLCGGKSISKLAVLGAVLFFLCWPLVFYSGEADIRQYIYADLPESSEHRVEIWHFTIQQWLQQPVIGWGLDVARIIPGGLAEVRPGWVLMPMHPHNGPLQILLEQGLVGYALFVLLLGYFMFKSVKGAADRYHCSVVIASWAAYLVIGFSAFSIWQAWWMAVGLMLAVLNTLFTQAGQSEELIK